MVAGWPRFDLYVITDPVLSRGRSHLEIARAALEGGADAVQLRDKSSPAMNLCRLVAEIQPLARKYGALLVVNDRVDVAMVTGADGAHVGQEDLPAREARRLLPRPTVLGVSAGTKDEARRAQKDGADYLGVGPVFPTATKPDAGAALGLEGLAAIAGSVSIPVVAIGGITMENVAGVIAAGAAGAAVVTAVVAADDMAAAARALKRRIVEARRSLPALGAER
ncbi:MAG TPA: thiamine phosphate synthase [Candidatus Polarisedimenticolia bacterium]|nr:thiamine phosphate synthase [Candidatus Polarisedimenticolia bacterium]